MRRTIKHVCSLAVILLLAIPVKAQVLLRVSDNEAIVGDTVEVSVYADSSLTGLNLASFTMGLSYSDYYVEPIEVNLDSTLIDTAGWQTVSNLTDPGTISFTGAGANTLSGTGRLVNIKFRLLNGGGNWIRFLQNDTYFNQGAEDVPLLFDDGYVRINPKPKFFFGFNPSILVIGDTSRVTVSGATAPITWSVSDTSLATIGSDGILRTKAYGTVDVIAEDSEGIRDTASVDILGFRLTSSDTTNYSGQEVEVHINTTDLTPLDISSGSFFLSTSMDNNLEVLSIQPGTIMDSGASINYTEQSNGIQIAFAQAPVITGSGNLLTILMKLKEDRVFSNYTTFSNPVMNEDINGTGDHFYIRSEELPALAISYTSQSRYMVGDSLQFSVSGNTGPVVWEVTNPALANIDSTGLMTSQKGGAFRVTAEDSIGARGETSEFRFYDVLVELPNSSIILGDTIMYPVEVSNLERSNSSVLGIDFTFTYDPSKLEYLGFSKSGSLTDGWSMVDNQIEANKIKIVGGSALPFTQSGDMIYLKFAVNASVITDNNTFLYVSEGLFNEGEPSFLAVNGQIQISSKPLVPVLMSPTNGANDVKIPVTLDWENALGSVSYDVQVSTSTSFDAPSLVVDTTGVLGSTLAISGLIPRQSYYWRVKSIGANDESDFSSYFSFTTIDQVPVVASALPDVVLQEDFSSYLVARLDTVFSDPEMQPLSYMIRNTLSFVAAEVVSDSLLLHSNPDSSGSGELIVQAIDVAGNTVTDTMLVIVTQVLDPPALVYPAFESIDIPIDVTLDWNDEPGATSYKVQVSTNGVFQVPDLVVDTSGVVGSSLSLSRLSYSGIYFWRVKAVNASEESGNSNTWVFSTVSAPNEPPYLAISLPVEIQYYEDFPNQELQLLSFYYSDPEGQPLTFSLQNTLSFVHTEIRNDSLLFNSIPDSSGIEELIFEVRDVEGASLLDTLLINVRPMNDTPYVVNLPDTISFVQGDVYTVKYDSAFADIEDPIENLKFQVTVSNNDILLDKSNPLELKISSPTVTGLEEIYFTVIDTEGSRLNVWVTLNIMTRVSNEWDEDTPLTFSLEQNYPNPFNPSSNIRFALPEASQVKLDVYNMLGQKVSTLINGKLQAGWHTVEFNASGLSTGTYIYRIQAGDFISTKKMMLVK